MSESFAGGVFIIWVVCMVLVGLIWGFPGESLIDLAQAFLIVIWSLIAAMILMIIGVEVTRIVTLLRDKAKKGRK